MPDTNTVRVFNLNIWNYNEPWEMRRRLIVEAIKQNEPDLVAIQEVQYRSWYKKDPRHQADQITERLSGYMLIWQPAHYYRDCEAGEKWEGLAILSRFPVVARRYLPLSCDEDDPRDALQRIVLGAEVYTLGGTFWLFTTHFPLSAKARERVVCDVYDFVMRTSEGRPFCLTGDFNAEPHSLPIRFLTGQLTLRGQLGTLIDAWALKHPDNAGFTSPTWEPRERIDYILVSSSVKVHNVALTATESNAQGIYPSDHCGLLAELGI